MSKPCLVASRSLDVAVGCPFGGDDRGGRVLIFNGNKDAASQGLTMSQELRSKQNVFDHSHAALCFNRFYCFPIELTRTYTLKYTSPLNLNITFSQISFANYSLMASLCYNLDIPSDKAHNPPLGQHMSEQS